jgi:hypothetical protein
LIIDVLNEKNVPKKSFINNDNKIPHEGFETIIELDSAIENTDEIIFDLDTNTVTKNNEILEI